MLDFSDRTRTGISKLGSHCAFRIQVYALNRQRQNPILKDACSYLGYRPDYAFDRDPDSYYAGSNGDTHLDWLQVDFKLEERVSGAAVHCVTDDDGYFAGNYNYRVMICLACLAQLNHAHDSDMYNLFSSSFN